MKELVFLPDRTGRDELPGQAGFVRLGAEASELGALAARLTAPAAPGKSLLADETAWRGVLALALLTDVWADCGASLTAMTIDASASPLAAWVLSSRPEAERQKPVHLLLIQRDGQKALLGLADEQTGLRLPASPLRLAGFIPEGAGWIDQETGAIADPVPFLNERDRAILLGRMNALQLHTAWAEKLTGDLCRADGDEVEAVRRGDADALERLAVRLEAAHGLADFDAYSEQVKRYASLGSNPLMACLGAAEPEMDPGMEESRTCLWNGIPFAVTSRELGLTGTMHPQSAEVIGEITRELAMMSMNSVRWNRSTGVSLEGWLDSRRLSGGLLPQAMERIEASCALLRENGRQVQSTVTLTWPWDAGNGAVKALLQETLGEKWRQGAAKPFSDRLTKMSGHALGDTALHACCAWEDGVLLPPLSEAMAACAAAAEPGAGIAPDAMRFVQQEDGSVLASFLLRGNGEVQMSRRYAPEEIVVLNADTAVSMAVWPCLPMEKWRAYHVFTRGGAEVSALCGGEWLRSAPEEGAAQREGWRCLHTPEYPACLSLSRDGLCLGAIPNALPAWQCENLHDMVAAIDLGSAQTALAFAVNGEACVLEGQELTRMLVSPAGAELDPFLAGLTPASVIPTAVMITGAGDELFTDGYVCRAIGLEALAEVDAQQLRTTLKWRSDAESVRARKILLHQVMLGASLMALMSGARSISWRVTIADEMGDEGREALLHMAEALASAVAMETGLALTQGQKAVSWAEESSALCTGLRSEGNGRGSYVSADLGGGSTKLHLWVQGQSRPVVGAVLLEGVRSTLMSALYAQPRRLLEDFADCGDERLLQAVLAICDQMNPDLASPRQTDKLGLMLDGLLDEYRQSVVMHMNARFAAQNPTYMQSVMLETEAAILFIAGLMLAQVGDNVMINHRLPEDITVCMTGRGAWLLETLTPAMRNSLQHLMHTPMRLDHPVRFVTLRASRLPAQSVAMGLATTRELQRISETPVLRTRESFSGLMRQLLQHLIAAFPIHMWTLHEGLFDWQGTLTPAGEDTIRRVASLCYGDGEDIPASIMAFVSALRSTPILDDSMIDPQA